MPLKPGDQAPEFTLFDTDRKPRGLREFLGKKTVIAFYPGAFTGVCTKEMCALRDSMTAFNAMDAQVVGISLDSPFANKAFADVNKLAFPLLSDFTREVGGKYAGIFKDFAGITGYEVTNRAVFVLDAAGKVRFAWIGENPGIEPDYEAIRKALSAF